MHDSQGVLSTQYGGFLALIVIGGLAGWIAGKIIGIRHGVLTNIIVGVAGARIGSELTDLAMSRRTAHSSISSPPWSVRRRFSISGN
jgi:uncharacterized membrane protein YeaQ/YmgE (transglycosylase-associated protein family)